MVNAIQLILLAYSVASELSSAMSSHMLIVNFNLADRNSIKLKLDEEAMSLSSTNVQLYEYIHTVVYGENSQQVHFKLEKLNSRLGRYENLPDNDETHHWSGRFTNLLVTEADSNESSLSHQLCIKGRSFSVSDGISIGTNGYTIHIQEQQGSGQASLGTGLNTWDGSVQLAKYLELHPHLVQGKRVLELGAGTGVAGIACGLLGSVHVTLSDLDYALDNLRVNADQNFMQLVKHNHQQQQVREQQPQQWNTIEGDKHSTSDHTTAPTQQQQQPFSYEVIKLDWGDSATYPYHITNSITSNTASSNSSSNSETEREEVKEDNHKGREEHTLDRYYDVIVGADIVWLEHLVPLLVQALVALMSDHTTLILSHQTRSERTDKLLFDSLAVHFDLHQVSSDSYHPEFVTSKIKIYTGRRRRI